MRKMRANAGNAADMDIIHKKLPLGKHTKEACNNKLAASGYIRGLQTKNTNCKLARIRQFPVP